MNNPFGRLRLPFGAGVVGSLTRPAPVFDLLPADPGPEAAEAARAPAMDAAVRYVVALQEQAGLDLVSDGEWRRHAYTNVIADMCSGFEPDHRPAKFFGSVVTEPITVTHPGLLAEEAKFLVAATDRATKVCVPGPYILGVRFWDPELSVAAYPTRESFVDAMVPVLRAEVLALRDAGVSVIQVDEPQLCTLVDPDQEPYYGTREYDIGLAAAKVNEVVGDLSGARTALHLCRLNSIDRSWVFEGGYGPIMHTLSTVDVDQFVMEFSIPVTGNVSVLRGLPEDKLIGLGCIDVRGEAIDTAAQVVTRVEEAIEHVDWQRISLNPDCGFAPDWRHIVPLDDCFGKLSAEAEAVEMLRQKYA